MKKHNKFKIWSMECKSALFLLMKKIW